MSEQELGYGQGYADGAFDERNAIIELLEDQDHVAWFGLNEAAIALIKSRGEVK